MVDRFPPSSRAGEGQVDPTWHCCARTRWSARCCLGRPNLALMPLWDALDTTRAKQTEAWIFTLGTVWQLLFESFKESSMPSATRSSCLTRQGQDSSEMVRPEPALEIWKSTSSLSVSLLAAVAGSWQGNFRHDLKIGWSQWGPFRSHFWNTVWWLMVVNGD